MGGKKLRRAGRLLQRSVNNIIKSNIDFPFRKATLIVDGKVGKNTLAAVNDLSCPVRQLFLQMWIDRIAYYRKISDKNKKLRKFLRNWIVRMEHIKEEAGL